MALLRADLNQVGRVLAQLPTRSCSVQVNIGFQVPGFPKGFGCSRKPLSCSGLQREASAIFISERIVG